MQYTVCNSYFTKSTRIYNLSHYLGFFTSICEELRYDGVLNCDKSHNMRLYTTERKLCYHKSQSTHLACVNSPALCRINAGGDNAGMFQNVSEAAQITLQRVKSAGKQVAQAMGKDLLWRYPQHFRTGPSYLARYLTGLTTYPSGW